MTSVLATNVPTFLVRLGFLGALLICASTALAQTTQPPGNSKQYHAVIRRAVEQFDRGNYDRAKALFTEAHQLFPNARTLRGLGMVAYTARDYVQAIPLLESAIASQIKPLDADLLAEARDVIIRSRAFIGVVRVKLTPASAQLLVNAAPAALGTDGLLSLNPGSYEVEAHAPGYLSSTRLLRIDPGATLDLDITLPRDASRDVAVPHPAAAPGAGVASQPEPAPVSAREAAPVPAPAPLAEAAMPTPLPEPEREASIAPWILAGVSGAVAIGGGVLLGVALSDVHTVENAKPTTDWSSVEGKYDRSPALSVIGITMIGAGVVGLAAGLTWHFLEAREPEEIALEASPLGVRVRGRW
jgi:hypothetical protein